MDELSNLARDYFLHLQLAPVVPALHPHLLLPVVHVPGQLYIDGLRLTRTGVVVTHVPSAVQLLANAACWAANVIATTTKQVPATATT